MLYRRARSLARTPESVRWVRRYSKLGEHGLLWYGLGAAHSVQDVLGRKLTGHLLTAGPVDWHESA